MTIYEILGSATSGKVEVEADFITGGAATVEFTKGSKTVAVAVHSPGMVIRASEEQERSPGK